MCDCSCLPGQKRSSSGCRPTSSLQPCVSGFSNVLVFNWDIWCLVWRGCRGGQGFALNCYDSYERWLCDWPYKISNNFLTHVVRAARRSGKCHAVLSPLCVCCRFKLSSGSGFTLYFLTNGRKMHRVKPALLLPGLEAPLGWCSAEGLRPHRGVFGRSKS